MSYTDRVLQYLRSKSAQGGCDDCLARKTGIRARPKVAEACRRLADEGTVVRKKGKCPLGDHSRVLNTLARKAAPLRSGRAKAGPASRSKAASASRRAPGGGRMRTAAPPASPPLGIEGSWRYVDRFCRALWVKHLKSEPPSSLAEMITTLRDRELIPTHEANMMHTIRSLRNLVVHENLDFGEHETAIARGAWEIVRAWAEKRECEAWRLTLKMCA